MQAASPPVRATLPPVRAASPPVRAALPPVRATSPPVRAASPPVRATLDLASGYWQVKVAREDRPKTAFSMGRGGLHQFVTMPFGFYNTTSTFERLMERVLAGLQ